MTSCSFGDDDLGTLYITTSSVDMTKEEIEKFPDAGAVFKVRPGAKGVKGNLFGVKRELQ